MTRFVVLAVTVAALFHVQPQANAALSCLRSPAAFQSQLVNQTFTRVYGVRLRTASGGLRATSQIANEFYGYLGRLTNQQQGKRLSQRETKAAVLQALSEGPLSEQVSQVLLADTDSVDVFFAAIRARAMKGKDLHFADCQAVAAIKPEVTGPKTTLAPPTTIAAWTLPYSKAPVKFVRDSWPYRFMPKLSGEITSEKYVKGSPPGSAQMLINIRQGALGEIVSEAPGRDAPRPYTYVWLYFPLSSPPLMRVVWNGQSEGDSQGVGCGTNPGEFYPGAANAQEVLASLTGATTGIFCSLGYQIPYGPSTAALAVPKLSRVFVSWIIPETYIDTWIPQIINPVVIYSVFSDEGGDCMWAYLPNGSLKILSTAPNSRCSVSSG